MKYFSMHLYGAEPQLLQMEAEDEAGAIAELKIIMQDVDFDEEEDDVVLFAMGDDLEGHPVFNYGHYWRTLQEEAI